VTDPAALSAYVSVSVAVTGHLCTRGPALLSAHVGIGVSAHGRLQCIVATQTLSAHVTVGFDVDPPALGEATPPALLSATVRIVAAARRSRLIAAAPGSDPVHGPLIGGPGTPWPLPATDSVGWIAADVTPSDLRGLSIKLGGKELSKALIEDLTIELSDRGGPESATLTFHKDVREPPVTMLSNLVVTYKGTRPFKGRLEARTRDLTDTMGTTLTFTGAMRALTDHRAFRRNYVDCDLTNWSLDQGSQNASSGAYNVGLDERGIVLSAQTGQRYTRGKAGFCGPNARAYYELFGGIVDNDVIRLVELEIEYGGWAFPDIAEQNGEFRLAVYARESLEGPNIECLVSQIIANAAIWDELGHPYVFWGALPYLSLFCGASEGVRCIVAKIEWTGGSDGMLPELNVGYDVTHGYNPATEYSDQRAASMPPVGFVIRSARVFGHQPKVYSHSRAVVRPADAIRDIVSPVFSTVNGLGSVGLEIDQLDFRDIPKTRLEALDDVDALLSYGYWSYTDDVLDFQAPGAGTVKVLPINDPNVSMGLSENIDETFNAVRVEWTDRFGKPRETVVNKKAAALGDLVKADCIDAPDAVKSAKSATQVGLHYLDDHNGLTLSDSVTVTGIPAGFGDALLARPGQRVTLQGAAQVTKKLSITRVTLHPLDWSADLQFDVSPWRFDRYLARLADGVKPIKRR
jgi:hypothetical protein